MAPLGAMAVICALALTACGGGDDDESQDDAEQVRAVIEQAATVDDPAHCAELMTPAFLERTEEGADPLAACEQSEAAGEDPADSVEITNVAIDGNSASADVAFTGGSNDGQTLTIELVREDEEWKLDRIAGFVRFDRAGYLDALAREFENDPNASPALAECAIDALDALSDEELQKLILSGGDFNRADLIVARACPREVRAAAMARLEPAFANLHPAVRACTLEELEQLSDERFLALAQNATEAVLQRFVNTHCASAVPGG